MSARLPRRRRPRAPTGLPKGAHLVQPGKELGGRIVELRIRAVASRGIRRHHRLPPLPYGIDERPGVRDRRVRKNAVSQVRDVGLSAKAWSIGGSLPQHSGGAYSQQGSRFPCSVTWSAATSAGLRQRPFASRTPITSAPVDPAPSPPAPTPRREQKAMTGAPAFRAMPYGLHSYKEGQTRGNHGGPSAPDQESNSCRHLRSSFHLGGQKVSHDARQPSQQGMRRGRVDSTSKRLA